MADGEEGDSLVGEVFAHTPPKHELEVTEGSARRRDFKPWHKPRKMWVRFRQWSPDVTNLIRHLKLAQKGRAFRYLSAR